MERDRHTPDEEADEVLQKEPSIEDDAHLRPYMDGLANPFELKKQILDGEPPLGKRKAHHEADSILTQRRIQREAKKNVKRGR